MTRYGIVDVSQLTARDVANLALQRTHTLFNTRLPYIGAPSYTAWARLKTDLPLRLEAWLRRRHIVASAVNSVVEDVEQIVARLSPGSVRSVCDIGCGYALHDVLLAKALELSAVCLIDIEDSRARHHDFNAFGAGYTNLEQARALVRRNAPAGRATEVTVANPRRDSLEFGQRFDLIISLLSCGFHYPSDTYLEFFGSCLQPTGRIVLDLRKGVDHSRLTSRFEVAAVVADAPKYQRVMLRAKD